jgi:hypothetical protein
MGMGLGRKQLVGEGMCKQMNCRFHQLLSQYKTCLGTLVLVTKIWLRSQAIRYYIWHLCALIKFRPIFVLQ